MEEEGKGRSYSTRAIIDVINEEMVLVKAPKLTDHNHICDEPRIVKWKMMREMEMRVMTNLRAKASVIRKAVVEYEEKYKDDLSTWSEVQVLLAEDIDHPLYIFKQKALKQLY